MKFVKSSYGLKMRQMNHQLTGDVAITALKKIDCKQALWASAGIWCQKGISVLDSVKSAES